MDIMVQQRTAEVYAMELYELPKEIPIAVISSSITAEVSSALLILKGRIAGYCRGEMIRY